MRVAHYEIFRSKVCEGGTLRDISSIKSVRVAHYEIFRAKVCEGGTLRDISS